MVLDLDPCDTLIPKMTQWRIAVGLFGCPRRQGVLENLNRILGPGLHTHTHTPSPRGPGSGEASYRDPSRHQRQEHRPTGLHRLSRKLAPQATAAGPGPMRASLFNIVFPSHTHTHRHIQAC